MKSQPQPSNASHLNKIKNIASITMLITLLTIGIFQTLSSKNNKYSQSSTENPLDSLTIINLNGHLCVLQDSSGNSIGPEINFQVIDNVAYAEFNDTILFKIKLEKWGPETFDPTYPTLCFSEEGIKVFKLSEETPCFAVRHNESAEIFSNNSKYAQIECYDPNNNLKHFLITQVYIGD